MDPVDENDIWNEQDGGEDSHVAAYRNVILEMEREIDEQSTGTPIDHDKQFFLNTLPVLDKTPDFIPRLGTPPPPNGVLCSHEEQGNSSGNRVGSPVNNNDSDRLSSPVSSNIRKSSLTQSLHTPLGNQDGTLTPISPRSKSPLLIRRSSPVLNDDTSPLFSKGSRSWKSPVVSEPVIYVKTANDGLTSNGKGRINDVESIKMQKAAFGDLEKEPRKSRVRTFKQRSAQENFGLYGLLTPALCLVPGVDGVS